MAQQDNISLDEAIKRYAWHEPFSMLVDELRQQYPESFAGARIMDDGRSWIAFASDVPSGALGKLADLTDALGQFGQKVELIENRGFTEEALDEAVIDAHQMAMQRQAFVENVSTGADIASGLITVELELARTARGTAEAEALVSEIERKVVSPAMEVRVRIVDEVLAGNDRNLYGGNMLAWSDGGSLACTSGFSVTFGSVRGLATAGHCDDTPFYSVSGADVPLYLWAEYESDYGDFEWLVSGEYHADDFFSGPYDSYLRDVSGVGFPTTGQNICRNGAKTGKFCDKVYSLNHCLNGSCRLALSENNTSQGGDSGGPWFYGNTAYGIHKGYKWWNFKSRSAFSLASYIDEALGVYIATS